MTIVERKTQTSKAPILGMLLILICLLLITQLGNPALLRLLGITRTSDALILSYRLAFWIALGLLLLYASKIERQRFLLWTDQKYSLLQSFAMILLVLLGTLLAVGMLTLFLRKAGLYQTSSRLLGFVNYMRHKEWLIVITAATAGVVEELIFRGYFMPRLEDVFKNKAAAIIISSALFGMMHFGYGTLINVLGPFVIGLVFACYYSMYRNIKVLIICHFLWDIFSILMVLQSHPGA